MSVLTPGRRPGSELLPRPGPRGGFRSSRDGADSSQVQQTDHQRGSPAAQRSPGQLSAIPRGQQSPAQAFGRRRQRLYQEHAAETERSEVGEVTRGSAHK